MATADSTATELWLHKPTQQWCKKIDGKRHYFGTDYKLALKRYHDFKAGKPKPKRTKGPTVRDLCNKYLTFKREQVEAGELTEVCFNDYHRVCKHIVRLFTLDRQLIELGPIDFQLMRADMRKRKLSARTTGNEINKVRGVFKFGYDSALMNRPVQFGPSFRRPSAKKVREERNAKGERLFTPEQIHKLLELASPQVRAMILLALNGGLSNSDIGQLPISVIDFRSGWLDYPRAKNAKRRRISLWPETLAALQTVLDARKRPLNANDSDLLFLTRSRLSWAKGTNANPISREFRKLLDEAGFYRPGLGFYACRHCFQTIGDEAKDPVATKAIMGHSSKDISEQYRERISDERLRAVTDHVRTWLYGGAK